VTDDRREFLTAALSSVAAVILSERLGAEGGEARIEGGTALAPSSKPVAQRDAPKVNLDGWQMTATEVTYPPGESSQGKHRHPGFVIGYVLEGQYRFAVNDEAPVVLAPGQMFFESFDAPGQVHAVSGNASTTVTTKILAIVFTKKGDPVTIPG
jgi:quercetin dioxygenase-like cupin family protein